MSDKTLDLYDEIHDLPSTKDQNCVWVGIKHYPGVIVCSINGTWNSGWAFPTEYDTIYDEEEFSYLAKKNYEESKRIGKQMKQVHELLEAEEPSVALRPIMGGGSGDWLSGLDVGTHFLAHQSGMFLSEFTLMGKRGKVVYLVEHGREGKEDTSSNYWVYSYLFSTSYKLERIIDD